METTFLLNLLENPNDMVETDLEKMEEMSVNFPYCQNIHVLIAKYAHDTKSMLAPQKIRSAAAYAYKRNILKDFLYNQLNYENTTSHFESIPVEKQNNIETIENIKNENNNSFFDTFEIEKIIENTPQDDIETKEDNETSAFFENLDQDGHPLYEVVNEGVAMGLYYDGNIIASIKMYKKLMLLYPSKKDYFKEQLISLLGKKIYSYQNELADLDRLDEKSEDILKEEITNQPENLIETIENNDYEWELELEEFVNNSSEEAINIIENKSNSSLTNTEDENNGYQTEDETIIFNIQNKEEKIEPEKSEIKLQIVSEIQPIEKEETQFISPMTVIFEENNQKNTNERTQKEEEKSFFDTFNTSVNTNITSSTITKVFPEIVPIIENKSEEKQEIIEQEVEIIENWTESQAIFYFQQGKNEQSIQVYEKLIELYPDKKMYFEKQIKAITSQKTHELKDEKAVITPIQFSPHTTENNEYSEELALRLFAQGRVSEAIFVYEKLSDLYPNKNNYYLSQIKVMTS